MPSSSHLALTAAALYGAWTALTWWFEGRIGTFLRPDAVEDRIIYALVVNLAVGVVASILLLRFTARARSEIAAAGLGAGTPRWIAVVAALVLGVAGYVAAGAPSLDPVVVLNAYAQVFVVSVAEILVCWSLPAAALEAWRPGAGWPLRALVLLVSAVIFGLYHFAHSPPFDTVGMVAFLALIGLVTGAFFVVTRDAYATVLLHNFMGMLGVTQALAAAGKLDSFGTLQKPLLAMAVATLAVALALDGVLLRRFGHASTH